MSGAFGLAYAKLIELGYAVLPIAPGTKQPGLPYGDGHWMGFPGWTTFQPTLVHLKLWALSSAGIAILTGPPSGDVIALDNDSNDPRIAEALRKVLPETPAEKKGAKGGTGFYRGPDIPSHAWMIDGRKVVEILGAGRQTVIPPSIHPDLGEPYRWTGPKTLEELRPEDLPLLPPDIIERISTALAPFGCTSSKASSQEPREHAPHDGIDADADADADTPHRRLNQTALDNLSLWVPALGLYRCRPRPGGGYEAVATWRPSTTGRDNRARKRNLKIDRTGIYDFGANQGYTPLDLVIAARECDLEAAFAFLCEQTGWAGGQVLLNIPDPGLADAVGGVGSSTKPNGIGADDPNTGGAQVIPLFRPATGGAASVRGPFPSSDSGTGKPESGTRESESSEPGPGSSAKETDATDDASAVDLESLTYVPGLVGDIVNWIVANARLPNRLLALAAAVTVVGALIGRRAMGPTGNATDLYIAVVAPASGGKDWPRKAIPMLLKAAGAGGHVHLGDITSQPAMNKVLTKMPLCVVVRDELVSFLSRITHPRSSAWEQSLVAMLCTLWSAGFDQFDTPTSARAIAESW
jgi:hypothetical protein